MDHGDLTEFLGQVPLLQCLPSSSLRKIAQAVLFRSYECGEYVAREGEPVDGLYVVLEGEAEVIDSASVDEISRRELVLKQYDYFGYGIKGSVHQVNVVALSKLVCLVLPNEYKHLLQPLSIWNADDANGDFSLVERILHLEPLEGDIFRGFTLPEAPTFRQVFGGQFISQALAAATKTVDCLKLVHSLHAVFILAGNKNLPIIYQVHRVREGKSFATRRVEARQQGTVMFTLIASFQKEEVGFEHQTAAMPNVPSPENLPNLEELLGHRLTDPRLPTHYRNAAARKKFVPWPVEIRFCEVNNPNANKKPSLNYWFRTRGKLSDDQALHRCVVAYASDLIFGEISLNANRRRGLKTTTLSLDHSMWFHRPLKADDWLLYAIDSPVSLGGRGFNHGRMFNRKGELVVSLTQEALIRELRMTTDETPKPKL